jgi:farnesol dehydrogenase
MKVLVTGVSGYLGGQVGVRLARAGHRVRGLVRDPSRWRSRPPGAEAVQGDVTDPAAFRRAAQGCQALVHAAAHVKVWDRDKSRFAEVNVGGLRHAADAAASAGAVLVYVSSFIALGPTDGRVFDEETPRAAGDAHNQYEKTKWEADVLARRLAAEGRRIVRLYPGVVYGARRPHAGEPRHPGAGPARAREAAGPSRARRPPPVLRLRGGRGGRGGGSAGSGACGLRLHPRGENRTVTELFQAFQAASGVPPPRRHIPYGVASLLGRMQRLWAELTGSEPELTDEVVEIYRHEWAYSSARAQRELGYRITPFAEGIARTAAWLRERGALGRGAR